MSTNVFVGAVIRDLAYYETVSERYHLRSAIVSCEITELIPGISQHFVSTVLMEQTRR